MEFDILVVATEHKVIGGVRIKVIGFTYWQLFSEILSLSRKLIDYMRSNGYMRNNVFHFFLCLLIYCLEMLQRLFSKKKTKEHSTKVDLWKTGNSREFVLLLLLNFTLDTIKRNHVYREVQGFLFQFNDKCQQYHCTIWMNPYEQ